jgi:hypothetical protein
MADWEASRALPFPCEVIDRSAEALTLNNCRYHFDAASSPVGAGIEPFEAIKLNLLGLCGTWSRLPHDFLEYYFREVAAIIEEARDELERQLAPYDGLFSYKDWRYSAPKPLPRAFLHAPDLDARQAFVQVEFAFWVGERLLAVQSQPEPLTPRAAAQRRERLANAGIEFIGYIASDILPGKRQLIERILGDRCAAFWSGEILPTGPFRPEVPMPVPSRSQPAG